MVIQKPQVHLKHGDNRQVMTDLLDNSDSRFRLVYLDPPFDTGLDWKTTGGESAYSDRYSGHDFMEMMAERLEMVRELLTEDGSLFLHCDYRRSPHLQMLCDRIFGEGARLDPRAPGFRNEIIWVYGLGGSSPRYYPRKHDNIYWYTKSSNWYFEPPRIPATSQRLKGQLKKAPDTWNIPTLNNMAQERTGYPTQKPLALLNRIVCAHTEPGDWVADFFCGSGTTLLSALQNGRSAFGCDASEVAIRTVRERLNDAGFSVQD